MKNDKTSLSPHWIWRFECKGGQGIRESYSMDLVSASKVEKVIWMDGDSDYAKV